MGSVETSQRPGRRGWVLAALIATTGLVAVDATIVATALPQVVADLGGLALLGWVFSGYLLGASVTIPVYGKLADIYGRKPIILVGASVFFVSSAMCAVAWDMPSLVCFRILQGIGSGGIAATVSTIAADLYSLRDRGRVQGYLGSVWGIAALAGPAMGGAFAEYATWRWIFLINVPVGVVALTLIVRQFREQVERHRHRIDYAGALGVLLTFGTLVFALLQGGVSWPWVSLPSFVAFALVVLFGVVTVVLERGAAEPILPLRLLRQRVLIGVTVGSLAMGMVMIGPVPFVPTYGQHILGLSPIFAGLLLASMSITLPLAASQSARFYLRIGFRDTALVGAALCLAGTALFWLSAGTIPWVLAAMLTIGAGLGLVQTSLLVGAQSTVDWDERGTVTGAAMFSRVLGQTIGAAVFGAVANASLQARLADAPEGLTGALPRDIEDITPTLTAGAAASDVVTYVRTALEYATQNVFIGLSICALVCAVLLLTIAPRQFPIRASPDERTET